MFSAYAYSGEPIKYKNYGLGALMSFIMMGPLMVYASFYVFSGSFAVYPILYSMALGLFIPAILVANELRDYEEDKRKGIGTLTVRIGFNNGQIVYNSLLAFAYINTLILIVFRVLPMIALVLFSTIPLLKNIRGHMLNNRRRLVAETAKIYLIFGMGFLIVLFL
jgi:1,4-dihydroxy-2-naphthoate octaprenyltransferase